MPKEMEGFKPFLVWLTVIYRHIGRDFARAVLPRCTLVYHALDVQPSRTHWPLRMLLYASDGATTTQTILTECVSINRWRRQKELHRCRLRSRSFLKHWKGQPLDEILQAESQITRSDVEITIPLQGSTCDPQSIHYCPTNAIQRSSFSRLVTNELILRGLEVNGNLETRRAQLLDALRAESTINRLSSEISHDEVQEGAYLLWNKTSDDADHWRASFKRKEETSVNLHECWRETSIAIYFRYWTTN